MGRAIRVKFQTGINDEINCLTNFTHLLFFPFRFFSDLFWRSYGCLLLLSPYSVSAGCHIICSMCTLIIGLTLHHLIMFRICSWHFTGWLWRTQWLIRLFTTGWIDGFAIIFKKSCAFVASICGNRMNCSKVKRLTCQTQCPLNVVRNHVSS